MIRGGDMLPNAYDHDCRARRGGNVFGAASGLEEAYG